MVHADAGDDRDQRRDHVRRIEPAAETGFHNGQVQIALGEPEQGQGGAEFKIGDPPRFKDGADARGETAELLLADKAIAHPETFPHIAQMGRGVEPDPVARLGKDREQRGAHRAFAVGAGHVDKSEFFFRAADPIKKGPHGLEPEFYLVDLQIVEIGQGFLVVHRRIVSLA